MHFLALMLSLGDGGTQNIFKISEIIKCAKICIVIVSSINFAVLHINMSQGVQTMKCNRFKQVYKSKVARTTFVAQLMDQLMYR